MRFLSVTVVLLLAVLTLADPVQATQYSNDQSDIWWNANESGWGIQFVQRGSTIFATMFVYDTAGNPTWYVAALQGSKPGGVLTFTGDLYTGTGPWFGTVPFDPANTTNAKVGTMTWVKTAGNPGTLTYTVNGVNVQKSLTRQPIASDNYTGTYIVGAHLVASGCNNPADNGTDDFPDTLTVTQNGTAITLTLNGAACTLTGTYAQNGQFGTASGSYSCADGDAGSFGLSNMIVAPYGMVGVLSSSSTKSGCQSSGQIGGARAG